MHQQHGRAGGEFGGEAFRPQKRAGIGQDAGGGGHRAAQAREKRYHGTLAEAHQRQTVSAKAKFRKLRLGKVAKDAGGVAEPSLHPRRGAVHDVEPLPAIRGALKGKGGMRGDEQGAGQGFRPDRSQINQVKAIRADTVQ